MWYVFKDESTYEGVPSSWVQVINDATYCLWPQVSSGKVSQLTKRDEHPSSSWSSIQCVVKAYADTYQDMIMKRRAAEMVTTDIHSESTNEENSSIIYRPALPRNCLQSSDDEYLNSQTPPRKKKAIGCRKQGSSDIVKNLGKKSISFSRMKSNQVEEEMDTEDDIVLPPPPQKKAEAGKATILIFFLSEEITIIAIFS